MQSSLWPQPTNGLVRPVQVCIGNRRLLGTSRGFPGPGGSAALGAVVICYLGGCSPSFTLCLAAAVGTAPVVLCVVAG